MGTKNNPGRFDCYANADRDEPMFVLLGRDVHAHFAVRKWADDREHLITVGIKPESDRPMVAEARECADAMLAYHRLLQVEGLDNRCPKCGEAPTYQTPDGTWWDSSAHFWRKG